MGLHVGWRHLRIGPGFTLRGFARRGVALLCESARQGFLTNATIECAILACARAVITLWLRSCCCCRCCWLISVAQEHDDGAARGGAAVSRPRVKRTKARKFRSLPFYPSLAFASHEPTRTRRRGLTAGNAPPSPRQRRRRDMSTADKVKKTKKKPSGVSALSFDMGDEGEAFAVKKSKKSRGHKHLKTSGDAAPAVDTQVSSGVYTADYLQQLRADTKFAPSSQAADGMDDAAEVVASPPAHPPFQTRTPPHDTPSDGCAVPFQGLVPGVDDIRKARSERERARRLAEEQGGCGLAGPEGAAFIPLDGSAASLSNGSGGGGDKYGESRLVREDQEADDEADGAALAFGSVAAGGRPKPEMPTVQDLPEELGVADVDVKFGRRPGLNGAPTGAGASSSESLAEHAVLLADATRAAAVPERLDDAVQPGHLGLQAGCVGLQLGSVRLQTGCIGLQPGAALGL